jgi:glycerol uptake facilitator-like aquaporin
MQTPNHNVCFFEQYLDTPLWRRSLTEALGTLLLALAVIGTGAMLRQDIDLPAPLSARVASSAIAAALVGLVIALGPVSGGHFNPLITILQCVACERSLRCTVHYCLAQLAGAGDAIGLMLWPSFQSGVGTGLAPRLLGSEVLCAAALMVVVFACEFG